MNKGTISKEIKEFLYDENLKEEFAKLTVDDSLLEYGLVDSVKMLDLIRFIENKFNITVDEEDMLPEYFDSINAITQYIQDQQ